MSRTRPDGYYVPTARTRHEHRMKSVHRLSLPLLVVAGMTAIPAISIALSESWNVGVAHAESNPAGSARDESAARLRATLRTHLRDDQIDGMKAQYLRNRNATILQRDLVRYADDVAQGNFAHMPREFRRIVRDHMTKDDIRKIRRWIKETAPTPDELIHAAKTEFAENLEEVADELMITRSEFGKR